MFSLWTTYWETKSLRETIVDAKSDRAWLKNKKNVSLLDFMISSV